MIKIKSQKKIAERLSVDAKFIIPVVIIVFTVCLILVIIKDKVINNVDNSINRYMGYLKETVFLSTYDSLKKGNMKLFEDLLTQIGTFDQVKEFSLLNTEGEILYSSKKKLINSKEQKVADIKGPSVKRGNDRLIYYFPVLTVEYCKRCHTGWKTGSFNSIYKISLDNSLLLNLRRISEISNTAIFLGGFLFITLLYIIFVYLKNLKFSEVISESEKKYRKLFENIMDVQFRIDEFGRVELISPSGLRLLGYSSENEIINEYFATKLMYDKSQYPQLLRNIYEEEEIHGYEMILMKKDGSPIIVEANLKFLKISNKGKIEGIFRDITDRKHYEEQLKLLASVFENTLEAIMIMDKNGNIQKVNQAFLDITGYSENEFIGLKPEQINFVYSDYRYFLKIIAKTRRSGRWSGEVWSRRKSGEAFPQWLSVSTLKNENNEIINYIAVFHDITSLKESEETLKYQANHDMLTGLPNRKLFEDRLERLITHNDRYGGKFALLFIDLDNFKNINDSLGHKVGDLLLIKMGEIFKSSCRESDTVARLSGDEFTIILNGTSDHSSIINIIDRILEMVSSPHSLQDHEVFTGASIGVTIYPDDGTTSDSLIKNADMAMYKAKELGKGNYYFYKEDLKQKLERRTTMTNDLAKALNSGDIQVYFQPKISLSSGKIVGAEALARWKVDTKTFIPPDEFIETAEESGLINSLGDYVLRKSCENLNKWHKSGFKDLSVAVNLSIKQMNDNYLVEKTKNIIENSGITPGSLIFEITENIAMKNFTQSLKLINELSDLDIKISLDDFGTGYSSLGYLKNFPLSSVKIDKIFMQKIPEDKKDTLLIKGIISMAKSMDLKVIAEGVEYSNQSDFLKKIGCDEYQGYYYSPPVDEEEFMKLLKIK